MQVKLLFIITDSESKIEKIINKFELPFNVITHGIGTASKSMLNFFGLNETEKNINLSLIPDYQEKEIFNQLEKEIHLKEIGNGIAFSVPLASSSKYIVEAFKGGNKKMENDIKKSNFQLIVSIVNEGFSDKVMSAAKRCGANGGTLIKGRELGGKNSFKFFNMTMEPEKDVVLIVCQDDLKTKIMSHILEKTGLKTEAQGICFSLPIDTTLGLTEEK